MFRLLGDWLAEFAEIREQLNAQIISNLDVFRHITLQLEREISQTGRMPFLEKASPTIATGRLYPVTERHTDLAPDSVDGLQEVQKKSDIATLFQD